MELRLTRRTKLILALVGGVFVASMIGTAIAGRDGALERDVLVRARVWCDSLIERDALRYQEAFRRNFFRGTFDRFANIHRDPTEASILEQMPPTTGCDVAGPLRLDEKDVYVPISRRGPGESVRVDLRMRREAGFWVIYQLVEPS